MSGFKDIAKGGWHPKGKDGKSKESWRSDNKGMNTVAGWMGKGKDSTAEAHDHVSRPLTTLKDPSAFGPPPKNVNYHGGAALPFQITPDTRGLGAPLSRDEIAAKQRAEEAERQREEEEAARPKPPPVPYRKDKTGLSTAHLPPPPGRKDGADGRAPLEILKSKPPSLPPRLPPRQTSIPMPHSSPPYKSTATPEPESHRGILNQNSLNNLSAAGVSIPGFGIGGSKGRQTLPPPVSRSSNQDALPSQAENPPPSNNSQLNELQSRFSRFSTKPPNQEATSEGTTFAQKQAALKTASSFRNDPSSVSLSDAKTAASTVNNFRERHGDQAKSGWQSANKLNNKYGVADKIGGMRTTLLPPPSSNTPPEQEYASQPSHSNEGLHTALAAKKKPPPPPPMKKPKLGSSTPANDPSLPPPIPLSSKPKPPVSVYH